MPGESVQRWGWLEMRSNVGRDRFFLVDTHSDNAHVGWGRTPVECLQDFADETLSAAARLINQGMEVRALSEHAEETPEMPGDVSHTWLRARMDELRDSAWRLHRRLEVLFEFVPWDEVAPSVQPRISKTGRPGEPLSEQETSGAAGVFRELGSIDPGAFRVFADLAKSHADRAKADLDPGEAAP